MDLVAITIFLTTNVALNHGDNISKSSIDMLDKK